MTDLLGWTAVLLWTSAAGLLAWYALCVAKQITYVTLADGRRSERLLPFIFRLLLPLSVNFKRFVSIPFFKKGTEKVDKMIVSAGFEGLIYGWELQTLKILMPLTIGVVMCLLLQPLCSKTEMLFRLYPILCICMLALTFVYPGLWLNDAVNRRKKSILRSMPFVLDLVTLSVEAGLDFMSAVQRTTERGKLDPLSEELLRMVREIQLGTSRRNALRAMSERIDLPDMRSLVNALVQADELGVAIGSILRIQSEQIRNRRFERAEKLANEAPTKLLMPLILFIFPSVFLILLGPLLYKVINQV